MFKFVTPQFAFWNIFIFMFGCFLGMVYGTSQQWIELIRHNIGFCGKVF